MRTFKLVALVLTGTSLGLAAAWGVNSLLPAGAIVRGVLIDGRKVPSKESPAGWLADENESEVAGRQLTVEGSGFSKTFAFSELGIEIDIEKTLDDAERIGHTGSVADRVKASRAAVRGEIDVPLRYHVREATMRQALEDLAPRLVRDPVDARLDVATMKKIPDVPGQALDVDATLDAIEQSDFHDGEVVEFVTKDVKAKITAADLTAVDVDKVVSSYETTFHLIGTGAGRAVNIANAAHFIDGQVIMPGDVFSFNEHVGPRTLERGFTWAPEIQADELTTGVGGGTCQASTTLFGAALFGNLEIVERRSHSRPSSYTKLGLDATVIYPSQDLKIKNTMPFPIMIHAFLPKPDAIRVELLGGDPVADVTYTFGIGSSSDFLRRITVKPNLPADAHILHQRGGRGYDVTSVVTIHYRDGRVEQRSYFSGYRPTPEVFWVGPGYDEKDLPPLPEHALGVEGKVGAADPYAAL